MITDEEVTLAILAGEIKCPALAHYGVPPTPCTICKDQNVLPTHGLSASLIRSMLILGASRAEQRTAGSRATSEWVTYVLGGRK